jgi:hypothetical protein
VKFSNLCLYCMHDCERCRQSPECQPRRIAGGSPETVTSGEKKTEHTERERESFGAAVTAAFLDYSAI